MARNQVTFVCPRGRTNRRSVAARGKVDIRCSCGCGFVYSVRFK